MSTGAPAHQAITELLAQWRRGDRAAERAVMETVYPILRAMAQRELSGGSGKLTLRATELAHEAYLRLLGQHTDWESRTHFLAIAARMIRRVVIDLIRAREADKRGAGVEIITIDPDADHDHPQAPDAFDLLAIDQALQRLEGRDAIAAQVVELRYFGGLTNDEVARVLDLGVATVVRHWQFGRAYLHRRLA